MGMVWQWAVLVDRGQGNPLVPYQTITWYGESEQDVKDQLKDLDIKAVTAIRPEVDWEKPTYSYAEACVYIGRSPTGEIIAKLQAAGDFDRPVDGRPKPIPKWKLDKFVNGQWREQPEAA